MNLAYLKKTDRELEALRMAPTKEGKEARKELQRRKAVGFWDGTMAVKVDPYQEIEEERTTEYTYATNVKRL
tara:strand:+ start:240 stop:455 length:216 start_codon:yes stop_codon:yes gene_type:complete